MTTDIDWKEVGKGKSRQATFQYGTPIIVAREITEPIIVRLLEMPFKWWKGCLKQDEWFPPKEGQRVWLAINVIDRSDGVVKVFCATNSILEQAAKSMRVTVEDLKCHECREKFDSVDFYYCPYCGEELSRPDPIRPSSTAEGHDFHIKAWRNPTVGKLIRFEVTKLHHTPINTDEKEKILKGYINLRSWAEWMEVNTTESGEWIKVEIED